MKRRLAKRRTVWLSQTLVTSPYSYCLCISNKEMRARLKSLGVKSSQMPEFPEAGAANIVDVNRIIGKQIAVISIGDMTGRAPAVIYSTLAHEAVHLWRYIKASMGERWPSPEFEAYSIEALTHNLISEYIART